MPKYLTYLSKQVLCVTREELEQIAVAKNTIMDGLKRQRQGLVNCWPHHKVGPKVFIHFDGLKADYQNRITKLLCEGVNPHLYALNKVTEQRQTELEVINSQIPDLLEIDPADIKELHRTGYYDMFDTHRIARAAAWLRLLNRIDVKAARNMGYNKITLFQEAVFNHVMAEQSKGMVKFKKAINNERVLDRNARQFHIEGIQSLITGLMGNNNRGKINPLAHAALMDLASDQSKLSFEDIGLEYNSKALDMGLMMLTVSVIKQHLNEPKHKRVWYYNRHGKHEGDLAFRAQSTRREISRPDALWTMDGTTMQLYYRDDTDKVKSDLYVYLVADAHSSAIIGASVGFVETSSLVTEALQKAVAFRNYTPFQLQYDNSSANVSGAVVGLMNNMTRVHFGCRPYSGQSKYIETFTGHLQQRVLRKLKNFKGGNVTTKSPNSKANPELLAKLAKTPELLPSQEQVVNDFYAAVSDWNARGEERDAYGFMIGESKIERYEKEAEGRNKVNYFDKISLFMAELAHPDPAGYKYTTAGIKLTLKKKDHFFIVPDEGSKYDFQFQQNHLNQRFKVRINIENPEFCILFKDGKQVAIARNKELFAACIADYKEGESAMIKDFCTKQEQFGWQYAQTEITKQRILLEANGYKATGTDGIMHYALQDKTSYNQVESAIQDAMNGMGEMSDLERKLLTITK